MILRKEKRDGNLDQSKRIEQKHQVHMQQMQRHCVLVGASEGGAERVSVSVLSVLPGEDGSGA